MVKEFVGFFRQALSPHQLNRLKQYLTGIQSSDKADRCEPMEYDFVHRNIYRLAVEDRSYKKALESLGREKGWIFEVEYYNKMPYSHREIDCLLVETPESCSVNCMMEWALMDAFAILYFRRDDLSFDGIRELARWKRISGTDARVWSAIKYGCSLFNTRLGGESFDVRKTNLRQSDIKELVEEAVEKVVEFA